MVLAIAISTFFGLVAAVVLIACWSSLARAFGQYRAIRAELNVLDAPKAIVPLRRPKEAFALAAQA